MKRNICASECATFLDFVATKTQQPSDKRERSAVLTTVLCFARKQRHNRQARSIFKRITRSNDTRFFLTEDINLNKCRAKVKELYTILFKYLPPARENSLSTNRVMPAIGLLHDIPVTSLIEALLQVN